MTQTRQRPVLRTAGGVLASAALIVSLAACSGDAAAQSENNSASATTATASSFSSSSDTFFSTDELHSIDVDLDEDAYEEMLAAYAETGDKNWISVTVQIDGTTFEDVGLRLKGNRSLRQALASSRGIELSEADLAGEDADTDASSGDATDPTTIPWLIRLDKYVDGQEYLGRTDFVVRGNDTASYLNEAVAMAMIEEAGLPAHRVAFSSFSVNGTDAKLRLISEVPDDALWNEEWFGADGATWKADSDGDWDYHGTDGADYESLWKQRTGTDDIDMTPIVEFMDFINNSTDEEFEAELPDELDVEAFATYLAVENLIGNSDTISGPGNNGYLHYDPATGEMTVVAWDHDLAFDSMGGLGDGGTGMGGPGGMGEGGPGGMGGTPPEGMEPPAGDRSEGGPGGMVPGQTPDGMTPPEGTDMPQSMGEPGAGGMGGMGGGMGGSNILESRFLASTTFSEMYQSAYSDLRASLIESGFAEGVLDQYAQLLVNDAGDLISASTVDTEAAAIQAYLTRAASSTGDNSGTGMPGGLGGGPEAVDPTQSDVTDGAAAESLAPAA